MVKLPLGRTKIGRGHFIEVQVLILSTQLFLDFNHWLLIEGGRLMEVQLYFSDGFNERPT